MLAPRPVFRSLSALARLLADPAVRGVSVDIYDTLLLRRTRPELLRFGDVARAQHAALRAAGLASPGADALWRARLRVHKAAYDHVRDHGGEVTIEAIIAAMIDTAGLTAAAIAPMLAAELAVEAASVRANAGLATLIAAAARSKPVTLTSDMYLRGAHLAPVLHRHLPQLSHLPLLVSSDLGASKRRGDMFALVAARLALPAAAILHLGDDPVADIRNAERAGCRAVWWPRSRSWRLAHALRRRLTRWMLRRRAMITAPTIRATRALQRTVAPPGELT